MQKIQFTNDPDAPMVTVVENQPTDSSTASGVHQFVDESPSFSHSYAGTYSKPKNRKERRREAALKRIVK